MNQETKFNGNRLDSISGFFVTEATPYVGSNIELKTFDIASTDGSVVSQQYQRSKNIRIKGVIRTTSKASLEQTLDALKIAVVGKEKILSINQSGATREYTATLSTWSVSNQAGGFADVELDFFCSDPYGYASFYTTGLTVNNLTTNNQSYVVTVTGSQAPLITINVDTVTGGTGELSLANSSTGTTLAINREWANGDILVIDAENRTVKVGGVGVDFDGAIPILQNGNNTLVYTDGFTTRQVDISVQYRKRYL